MKAAAGLQNVAIVIPVFNDWASLQYLLKDVDAIADLEKVRFHVVVVDDASSQTEGVTFDLANYSCIDVVEVVHLVCNLGHQRAIAIGLTVVNKMAEIDHVVVMDSDGEDCPADISRLLAMGAERPGKIICAQRTKRSERIVFRLFYAVYKATFRALTGARIDFGNFCVIPKELLKPIIHNPGSWNNLAATIVRSRVPFERLPTHRGRRYSGQSQMNFVGLLLHGLSAISVYSDIALVRLIIFLLTLAGIASVGLATVVWLRLMTELAIPGWASSVAGSLVIILLQSLLFSSISMFILLNARSTKTVIPVIDAEHYVTAVERHALPRRDRVAL